MSSDQQRPPTGDQQRTRFALLCHQRSGSNALTSLLQQHDDIAMYGQLFNDGLEYRGYHRETLDLPLFRPHPRADLHHGPSPPLKRRLEKLVLRFVSRATDVEAFTRAFHERFQPDRAVIGCKVHDFQLVDDDMRRFLGQLDRVVVLTRRNLLRAAVSWAVAIRSDVWVAHSTAGRRRGATADDPITLDVDEVRWFIDKTTRTIDTWRRLVEAAGIPALWLTYEDNIVGQDLDPLWEHLGIGPVDGEFATRKLARSYDHVANAERLDAELGNDETGHLFDGRTV